MELVLKENIKNTRKKSYLNLQQAGGGSLFRTLLISEVTLTQA